MNSGFKSKVALVTGGSSGMGQATAVNFAALGAKVIVADVQSGDETVNAINQAGGNAFFVKTDVSKSEDVRFMVGKTIEVYGRLDCAVNCAGIDAYRDFLDWTEAEWDEMININLKGVWLCMMQEIPQMLKVGGGTIVNVASVGGLIGFPMLSAYVASKHGVLGLTKSASLEFAGRGIRVNAVCPGFVATPMLERGLATMAENVNAGIAMTPMARPGSSEELAAAAVWLCSDEASFVTGITLAVDGGWSQH